MQTVLSQQVKYLYKVTPSHFKGGSNSIQINNMQSVLGKVIGPAEPNVENLEGRVAVVTGGALGIGYVFDPFSSVIR